VSVASRLRVGADNLEVNVLRTVFASVFAVAVLAGPALGADYGPYRASPQMAAAPFSAYNWNGAYVGLNLGYQFGDTTNWPAEPSGFAGGLQAGFNWQSGQWVFGAETDIQISGADDTFAGYKFSNPWFGTVRGRAGYALNNVLLYLTAGLAYGRGRVEFAGMSEGHAQFGWTLGLGVEVGFTPNWSARAEFLYVDLSDHTYGLTGLGHGFESSLLRFGVNYRF
jgi:outer membrane immunogenic protein